MWRGRLRSHGNYRANLRRTRRWRCGRTPSSAATPTQPDATDFSRPRIAWTVVTPSHHAAELRDELLARLARHGTWQAVEQLGRLREADPRGGLLDRHYRQAIWTACQGSWQPLTPAELAEFIDASHPRVVHDSGQLLELVTTTLQELQHDLLVDSSLVNQLWDAQYAAGDWRRPVCWRPKSLFPSFGWFLQVALLTGLWYWCWG